MIDLYAGAALIAVLSAGIYFLGRRIALRATRPVVNLTGFGTVVLLAAYGLLVWDRPLMLRLLPLASVVVLGNWFLPLAAFHAGLLTKNGRSRSSLVCSAALAATAAFALVYPIAGSPPECGEAWDEGVCLQTTSCTCSPASAVTLLKQYGIASSEREMAELCLTRDGTTWPGLYRGLCLKTAGTPLDVAVFDGSVADLHALNGRPAILTVELQPQQAALHPDYEREAGWIPGQPHSVVFLGFTRDGQVKIADPANGREYWSLNDLKTLWKGRGLYLRQCR